ncbi:MAG TPA: DUF1707 domain-containing protein [Streptosporangiaceae bacterium]|jgi:hypothetical protein|nr:DUF1707 domain-containing protein [Streptosporangiaceae bacterium]
MMPPPGHGHLRASHADRERAIDVLKAAFAEGRLNQEEYTDRVGLAHASRTYDDLGALVADLPVGPFGTLAPAPGPLAPAPVPAPVPPARLRLPPRTSMTPLVIAALIAGIMVPTIAIPVLAVVACVTLARSGPARERRIRLAVAGAVLALLVVATVYLGL